MTRPSSVLLIISGSIAAYKSLELIRGLRERGCTVNAILSKGGAEFITPLAVSSLTGTKTYSDMFSLTDEVEMGHIELSRSADVVLVAPASANIIAQMATGQCPDLATTALLATNKPVFIAPAMNHKMWEHAATQRNIEQLRADGITIIEPTEGAMACGEYGVGRLAEPDAIIDALFAGEAKSSGALKGKHVIVTSGPTHEPVDPVRFLGNRSSGKQGHAIAAAFARAGADVTLISGPVNIETPRGVNLAKVESAEAMHAAVMNCLPADVFVGAAAVADWRVTHKSPQKIKKHGAHSKLTLELIPTRDILHDVGHHKQRPELVIGFAAETEALEANAQKKRATKNADWIIGNNVSGDVFGADSNEITIFREGAVETFPRMSKNAVADAIVSRVSDVFARTAVKKKPTKKRVS